MLGDVVASLGELVPQIEAVDRSAWIGRCKATKERYPFTYTPSQEGQKLKPQEVVQELDRQAEALGSESNWFPFNSDFNLQRIQRRNLLSRLVLANIKCGPVSTTDGLSLVRGSLPVALVLWASVFPQLSAPRLLLLKSM